jgi:membrane protease YdiL (CAAX protease family)
MKKRTNRELVTYFTLAYALSWCVFVPLALAEQGVIAPLPAWVHYLGAFGPLVSAFVVTSVTGGGASLRELLSRVTRWRIGWVWWGVALLSPVVLFLLAALVVGLVSGDWSVLGEFGTMAELPQLRGMAGWLVWILTFGLGEEIGWRGFALPRLQKERDARSATLILGLLWAAWHTPTFFYNYELSIFSVVAFTVGILSGAAVLTWLYNTTGGSVLAAIVWHGTYNAAVASGNGVVSAVVTAGVIAAAVFIANRFGPESFSHREKQTLEGGVE